MQTKTKFNLNRNVGLFCIVASLLLIGNSFPLNAQVIYTPGMEQMRREIEARQAERSRREARLEEIRARQEAELARIAEAKRQFDERMRRIDEARQRVTYRSSNYTQEQPLNPQLPGGKFFDPKSGLYFDNEDDMRAYQAANSPTSKLSSIPAYIWLVISLLVIVIVVMFIRNRKL